MSITPHKRFTVYYWKHTIRYAEDKEDWRSVTKFINFLDSMGGYADEIKLAGEQIYKRVLDEEDGSDYWLNKERIEVVLEQEDKYWGGF